MNTEKITLPTSLQISCPAPNFFGKIKPLLTLMLLFGSVSNCSISWAKNTSSKSPIEIFLRNRSGGVYLGVDAK